jgi:hypothetical protein
MDFFTVKIVFLVWVAALLQDWRHPKSAGSRNKKYFMRKILRKNTRFLKISLCNYLQRMFEIDAPALSLAV